MAPLFPWTIGAPPCASPRCRGRWKKHRVAKLQVNLLVVACSLLALGSRQRCPVSCRTGMGLSAVQRARLPRHLALAKQWSRAPCDTSGRGKMKSQGLLEFGLRLRGAAPGQQARAPPPLAVSFFVASRATFCRQDAHFVPVRHRPVFEAAANMDSRLVERDRPLDHGLRPMRHTGSSEEVVAFAPDLDRSRKLFLAKLGDSARGGCAGAWGCWRRWHALIQQRVEIHVHMAAGADAALAECAAVALGSAPCGAGAAPAGEAAGAAGEATRRERSSGLAAGKPASARAACPEAATGWKALAPTLPGRRYSFASGTRLRRFASEQAAVEG
ncbi:unnamed protein product [Prorocentrum cordatum]|uniref:Uncharacterized protein n=1 Tax=Prorocentrum cordatum TaxID=2364126 RepID=A0ABN9XPE1_9DINO|nr:unnamed protein product [Polarella glacialis]